MICPSKYITFFDVETTGFDYWNCSVIALACIVLEKSTSKVIGQFLQYAKPESVKHWSQDAEEVHSISYSMSQTFQSQKALSVELLHFLKDYRSDDLNLPFWYHGRNSFDYKFIMAMMLKQNLYWKWNKCFKVENINSTYGLAKTQLQLSNYKLNTICEHLGIELEHHEAMSDTNACKEIYLKLEGQRNLFL